MDKKLLLFILDKCQTRIEYLSKKINIKYIKLWCVLHNDYIFTNDELDILAEYLKDKKGYSDHYIDKRINKIKRRNNGDIKRDR